MGWLAVVAAVPLVERMQASGLGWLVGGGLAYTAGAGLYLLGQRRSYAHCVWHVCVLVGSTCHFFAALWHAR
jgi:hemolysin III